MKACPQCNLRYPNESTFCFVDGTGLVPINDPRLGTTVAGRYVLEDVLGEGGMATVYRARHKLVDRPCAVKVMNPTLAKDPVVRERFRREAKSAQKLAHPNIIEIFDQGDTEDGTAYMVMELLPGQSLAALIEKGKIPLPRALPIMVQIARALARAHDFEVLHRDLKPENIFVAIESDGTETVKLLDFGIARSMQDTRLTGLGEVFGTPQYMAPERITSIDAGPGADLYALGIVFFEMLTHRLPFEAADIPNLFVKHLREQPPKLRMIAPEAPATMESLIDRLLAKDPHQRPVDAHRVHNDLIAICEELHIALPKDLSNEAPSVRGPLQSLPPVALDRWVRRTTVFEQMLARAYSHSPRPDELVRLLEEIRRLIPSIAELRNEGIKDQHTLETLEDKGREGRQRFGAAMDALGIDASAAREEARAAQEVLSPLAETTAALVTSARAAHREIVFWEGRSGFQEPYVQLSTAYRTMATLVDQWLPARAAERVSIEALEAKERTVSDLEFQIQELRSALGKFEHSIEAEKTALKATISALGKRADALEGELLSLASRFCAPLRGRAELSPLFQELEAGAVAA